MAVIEPRDDTDWEQFAQLTARSYGHPLDATRRRISALRPAAIARFEITDDRVLAGAIALPCNQYFGGRPVPAAALSTLCVAPHERGSGHGRRVVWSLADAMGRDGIAVAPTSSLATRFLRNLGWELCGQSFALTAPTGAITGGEFVGGIVCDPDPDEVRALRTRVAPAWSGTIERPSWWTTWNAHPNEIRLGWREGTDLQGYLAYRTTPAQDGDERSTRLLVTELWTQSRDALDGLLRVLGTEQAVSPTVTFDYGVLPPDTPVRYRVDATLQPIGVRDWMLRVINPELAIACAGWPTISGRLELEVAALGRPSSVMTVDFTAGTASISPGSAPRVRMSTGAFATWFAGALPATQAAKLGIASGPTEDLAFMDLLVADRRPWLPDIF